MQIKNPVDTNIIFPSKPAVNTTKKEETTAPNKITATPQENNQSNNYEAFSSQPKISNEAKSAILKAQFEITDTTTKPKDEDPFVKDFLEYMSKTPEERMREHILRKKGLTEEQLAAMPAEEREKVEKEIAEEIKNQLKETVRKKEDKDSLLYMAI